MILNRFIENVGFIEIYSIYWDLFKIYWIVVSETKWPDF